MTSGYIIVSLSFLILATICSWNFIKRGGLVLKAVLIACAIWYCIAIYAAIPSFMGWPTNDELSEEVRILSIQIKEPDVKAGFSGSIYLWVDLKKVEKIEDILPTLFNPLIYNSDQEPRAFKVPYSKDLHRKILQMLKKQREEQGMLMVKGKQKGKKKKRKGGWEDDQLHFRVLNPRELLLKQDAGDSA